MPRTEKLSAYKRKRDFKKTREPSGAVGGAKKRHGDLQFVIQKHAATRLHYDFRLELDGVMKSWAVPKGPSLDPSVKRLAVEVEDHPMEYNTFEGTIPKGQYGGGTVMLWDRGMYTAENATGDAAAALREGYERGEMKLVLEGERLRGSWVLVRLGGRRVRPGEKTQWLLIKHRDEFAEPGSAIAEGETSVATGRTMDEIADGDSDVWQSNRSAAVTPMLARVTQDMPPNEGWTFEPKYDGVRVLAFVDRDSVALMTRNAKDKRAQFPEIADALADIGRNARRRFVLDGEIVALADGEPARFQALQSRTHLADRGAIERQSTDEPVALVAFDILFDGDTPLVDEPWVKRRERLERLLAKRTSESVRLGETTADGPALLARARRLGWEGMIAKRVDATYRMGVRSDAWLKLKVEHRQEFVAGGYTEPRNSRKHLGALLLGVYEGDDLIYAGHTGGGFTRESLADIYRRLAPLERKTSPFREEPKTNEAAHWVAPRVVVEVKFSEWTSDGRLRQPIFVGVRDDKDPRNVRREAESVQKTKTRANRPARAAARATAPARPTGTARGRAEDDVVAQLDEIEKSGGNGTLVLGRGKTLDVTNLGKVFFPKPKRTKGDLMRYYARVAPAILPVIKDRPLVLRRFPNGVEGQAFYQQNAPDDVPDGVRVEVVKNDEGEEQRRFIGGDLLTLLYTIQLGAISVDPWHARVQTCDLPDYTVLDLDPGESATFRRVVDVAGFVKEEIDRLGLHAGIKTSGATGLHIFVPLPPRLPTEAALLVAQIIATRVAHAHPKEATVTRAVKARGTGTVYVDYLQNIKGKTVAAAYAARARPEATVSTPLAWDEIEHGLNPRELTIDTVPARLAEVGDIWKAAMAQKNTMAVIRKVADESRT